MSWTDRTALETIQTLRDEFKVKYFIETGTFKGINALVQSKNFEYVFTCEINPENIRACIPKFEGNDVIYQYQGSSVPFLAKMRHNVIKSKETVIIYLDAHFYDEALPKEKRFVVLDELKALEGLSNAIIIVHDFWNSQFTGITYDGIKLDIELLRENLLKVNPEFCFYTNTECNVYNKENIKELIDDADADDNIEYANSSVDKRDRGILYCIPKDLDVTKYKLRKL